MDQEKLRKVKKTIESIKEGIIERIPSAVDRSPDTLAEEFEMLHVLL